MRRNNPTTLYRLRKPNLTLLELVISISLTLIILGTLTFFYHQIHMISAEMDRTQMETFQKRYVENRLATILPRIIPVNDQNRDFHFFSGSDIPGVFMRASENLVFTFDNCVKLDRDQAFHVIGRLYLDQEGNFTLATWPSEKRWEENVSPPMAKEILMQNVEELSFSFFVAPEKSKPTVEGEQVTTEPKIPPGIRGSTVNIWYKEYRELPAIIKISLKRRLGKDKIENMTFAFPLPHVKQPITYDF